MLGRVGSISGFHRLGNPNFKLRQYQIPLDKAESLRYMAESAGAPQTVSGLRPAEGVFSGRAMKRADPFYLSPEWKILRLAALRRDRWRCVICGVSIAGKGQATVDHIKPR